MMDELRGLTARQREVLSLLASVMTDSSIAQALGISVDTVKTHTRGIYEQLQIQYEGGNPRVLATLYAIRAGVVRAV